MTFHLRILFPLKRVTLPYSSFLQRGKHGISSLQQLELLIYMQQEINYLSKQIYDLPEILNVLNF